MRPGWGVTRPSVGGWGHGSTVLDAGVFHVGNSDLSPFLDAALPGGAVFAQLEVLEDHLALFGHPVNPIPKDGTATIYQLRQKSGLLQTAKPQPSNKHPPELSKSDRTAYTLYATRAWFGWRKYSLPIKQPLGPNSHKVGLSEAES